jgi:hypothetical protein
MDVVSRPVHQMTATSGAFPVGVCIATLLRTQDAAEDRQG